METNEKMLYETRWTENGAAKSEKFKTPEEAWAKMRQIVASRSLNKDGTWDKEFLGVWNHEPLADRAKRLAAEQNAGKRD